MTDNNSFSRTAATRQSGRAKKRASRRVGRPRVDQRPRRHPPEDEILFAAGKLFVEKGFAATSTREIAEAAGLRQAGIYNYYSQKLDILEALAERIVAPGMERLAAVDGEPVSAVVKLYRFLFLDLLELTRLPYDLAALVWLREFRAQRFRRFRNQRRRLLATLERWIRDGIEEGDLSTDDARFAANIALGTQESTFGWYRHGGHSAEVVATAVADQILRGLLSDPTRLPHVRREALDTSAAH